VRVLHVAKGLGPGGAERLLVSLAKAAEPSAVRHEVAYLLHWKQHLVPELEAIGVPTHLLAGPRGLLDPRWPGRLRARAGSVDVVHVHSPAVAAVARPVVRSLRNGPALVTTEHNVWRSHVWPTRLANAATAPLDQVRWAVSEEVVRSMWGPWRRRCEVLVHGVPVADIRARREERAASRASMGWQEGDVVIAIVANLRANKDYPTLFEAAAQALGREPSLRFVSVGQGPLEDELREALARRRLGDRFEMLGYHPDPLAVLAGADVFTLSSRHEGLPISLLEAMAIGLPPIVTRVGGNAEVVREGLDGVLVPAEDPSALAAAYTAMAGDPDERARLGISATRRAEDFDIARTARVVEDRYQRLAAARRQP
jgi:glycosyltransferase involved in cell wall biosynthesis